MLFKQLHTKFRGLQIWWLGAITQLAPRYIYNPDNNHPNIIRKNGGEIDVCSRTHILSDETLSDNRKTISKKVLNTKERTYTNHKLPSNFKNK